MKKMAFFLVFSICIMQLSANTIVRGKKISTQSGGGDVTIIECEYNPSEICYTFNGDVLVKKTMVRNQNVISITEKKKNSTTKNSKGTKETKEKQVIIIMK